MDINEKMEKLVNGVIWEYHNSENRCKHCGEYEFVGEHEDDCPAGALLALIEKAKS